MPVKKTKTITKKATAVTHTKKSTTGFSVDVYSIKGEKTGTTSLSITAKNAKVNQQLVAQAMRVYLANTHQGTAATKTRSEVTGSTRKIYRQKGTGRARHGDIKAPIFVGGGIAFGPHPRAVKRKLPKAMRRQVLTALLTEKVIAGKLKVVKSLNDATGKTRDMAKLCKNMGTTGSKVLVIVEPELHKAKRGFRNIEGIEIASPLSVSPLSLIENENLLVSEQALAKLPL